MTDNNNSNGTNDIKSNHATFLSPSLQSGSSNATVVGSDAGSIKSWSLDRVTNISIPSSEQSPTMISGSTKVPKPHSRTAIGHLVQSMMLMPSLYVTDVLVESSVDSNSWEPVNSRRLKFEAIQKWLSHVDFDPKYEFLTQNSATQGVVRVIVLVPGKEHEKEAKSRFEMTNTEPLVGISRTVKTEQGLEERQIRCRIQEPKPNSGDTKTEAFNFVLNHLLALQDYLEVLPLADGSIENIEPELQNRFTPTASLVPLNYKLHLRMQPSVDMGVQHIYLDVDIVPCVPEKPLYEVAKDLVGHDDLTKVDMEKIADSLRGLKVRCRYVPGKRTQKGRDKAQDNANCGRAFYIKDIEMPDNKPENKFEVNGLKVTVYEYFEKFHGIGSLNNKLPLVKDDTDALIPIELVLVDGTQPLIRYGYLNDHILKIARRFLNQGGASQIKELGGRFMNALVKFAPGSRLEGSLEFERSPSLTFVNDPVVKSGIKIDMYFITPGDDMTADNDLRDKVYRGLSSLSYDVGKLITISSNELEKKLEQQNTETKLIFALIQDRKKSEQDPDGKARKKIEQGSDKIVRQLHQFADRQRGLLVVSVMTSSVEEPYNRSLDEAGAYFPANLRYKINYMLGGINFNYTSVSMCPKARLMIAGSHTAHFSSNKGHYPSVSAVVATTSTTGGHYLGSTCIQVTTGVQKRGLEDKLGRNTISGVADLGRMMQERFRAFKDQPTHLLYYHDSTCFDDEANNIMCQQIRDAHKKVYGNFTRLNLTYIVVNKNTELAYNTTKPFEKNKTDPRFDFIAEDAPIPKYRYYVICNDQDWKRDELCFITRRINSSTQLSPSPVTASLPTLLASKLCTRVASYFRYDMQFPTIKREKRITQDSADSECKAEEDVKNKVLKHLKIGDEGARLNPWKAELDGTMFYL